MLELVKVLLVDLVDFVLFVLFFSISFAPSKLHLKVNISPSYGRHAMSNAFCLFCFHFIHFVDLQTQLTYLCRNLSQIRVHFR